MQVSINYPGASAQVVADTVAAPIEQQVNGVEGMLYMSSQMGNDGSYSLTVTFDVGTDLNTALVMVQNRVALAMPMLPTAVQNQGITIRKRDARHPDDRQLLLAQRPLRRPLPEQLRHDQRPRRVAARRRRVGRQHLRPARLQHPRLARSAEDGGLRASTPATWPPPSASENLDVPAGRIGQPPAAAGQHFDLPIDTLGRLDTPEQFGDIIVKVDQGIAAAAYAAAAVPIQVSTGLPNPGIGNPPQGGSSMRQDAEHATAIGTSAGISTVTPTTADCRNVGRHGHRRR